MTVDISVVIATFRRPGQLREAIASVLGQAGSAVEVLVIDDCGEASAQAVVQSFQDPRITYMQNPQPTGGVPSIVRNMGWPRAQGTFIHFLDDDDIVPDGHYAAVKAAFDKHPDIGVVFGRIEPFGTAPGWQLEHERRFFAEAARRAELCSWFGPRWAFAGCTVFDRPLFVCSAAVLRRECLVEVGGFDPEIRLMEDAEFYARVMRSCGACFLDRVALLYRIGTPSLMHAPSPDQVQLQRQKAGRSRMQAKYRRQRGTAEFYALAAFTRLILRGASLAQRRPA